MLRGLRILPIPPRALKPAPPACPAPVHRPTRARPDRISGKPARFCPPTRPRAAPARGHYLPVGGCDDLGLARTAATDTPDPDGASAPASPGDSAEHRAPEGKLAVFWRAGAAAPPLGGLTAHLAAVRPRARPDRALGARADPSRPNRPV